MNVFQAGPDNSRFILKCCQKYILNFRYSKNTTRQGIIFPYIKSKPDIHSPICFVLHSGVSTAIQTAKKYGTCRGHFNWLVRCGHKHRNVDRVTRNPTQPKTVPEVQANCLHALIFIVDTAVRL